MAFKFSPKEVAEYREAIDRLINAGIALESAADTFNLAVRELLEPYIAQYAIYNEHVIALKKLMTEHARAYREMWDRKSDKWQASLPGEKAVGWIETLDQFVELLEPLEAPDTEDLDVEPELIELDQAPSTSAE
jgi:hypothetical protein